MSSVSAAHASKCFSVVQIYVSEIVDITIRQVAKVSLPQIFWSSRKDTECEDGTALVGVDLDLLVSATKTKARSFPLCDHHSERAAIIHVQKNLTTKLAGMTLSSNHVVTVMVGTKYSSCRNCARTFGRGDRQGRVANALQRQIMTSFGKENVPHVLIVHQGMKRYSTKAPGLPVAETFPSDSLVMQEWL